MIGRSGGLAFRSMLAWCAGRGLILTFAIRTMTRRLANTSVITFCRFVNGHRLPVTSSTSISLLDGRFHRGRGAGLPRGRAGPK